MANNDPRGQNNRPDGNGGEHQTWYDGDVRYSQDVDRSGNVSNGHFRVNGPKDGPRDPFDPFYDLIIDSGFDPGW